MRYRGWIVFSVIVVMLASCGTSRQSARSWTPFPDGLVFPPDLPASQRVLYAYLEGVKNNVFDDDPRAMTASVWFEGAIELDTTHAPSYYELASIVAPTEIDMAISFAEKAYRLDTTNMWYLNQLGRMVLNKGDYDRALEIFSDLVVKESHDVDNYRVLALLQQQAGQPYAAIMTLDSAENKVGRMEPLVAYRQQLLMATKQYQRAEKEAEEAVEMFPYSAESYLSLAKVYSHMGRDSSAMVNFRKAMEIDSTDLQTIIALNDFYESHNDMKGYLSTMKKIFMSPDVTIEQKLAFLDELRANRDIYRDNFESISSMASTLAILYPDNYRAVDAYATSMLGYGNVEEANKLYKNFIANNSEPPIDAYREVMGIESYLERPDSVKKYTDLAISRFPGNVELYIRKGSTLAMMDDYDGALADYEAAVKYAGSDSVRSTVYGVIGDMYHQRDNAKQAYAYYRKALKMYPDNDMVLNNYAYYLAESGQQLPLALKMIERATRLRENVPTFLDTHAWVLYKMGRYDQAKKVMQQAISLDRSKRGGTLQFHYGEILWALGDHFLATVYWKKALEMGYDEEIVQQRLKQAEGK